MHRALLATVLALAVSFGCSNAPASGPDAGIDGARGAGAAGVPCTSEADCASALCIESDKAGHWCSALCVDAGSCPPTLPRCLFIGFGVDRSICSP